MTKIDDVFNFIAWPTVRILQTRNWFSLLRGCTGTTFRFMSLLQLSIFKFEEIKTVKYGSKDDSETQNDHFHIRKARFVQFLRTGSRFHFVYEILNFYTPQMNQSLPPPYSRRVDPIHSSKTTILSKLFSWNINKELVVRASFINDSTTKNFLENENKNSYYLSCHRFGEIWSTFPCRLYKKIELFYPKIFFHLYV